MEMFDFNLLSSLFKAKLTDEEIQKLNLNFYQKMTSINE